MKTKIFYLKSQVDPHLIEVPIIIRWHDYIAGRYIPSTDLICLVEEFYFSN